MALFDSTSRAILAAMSPAGQRARLVVLNYHRVPAEFDSLVPYEPDVAMFEKQLQATAQLCNVVPLPEAIDRLQKGTLPSRAACITFDDGYRNNYECAAPVLRKLGLPGTFFVTKGAVDDGIMWNDLIVEAVRGAGPKFADVPLPIATPEVPPEASPYTLAQAIIDAVKYKPLVERWHIACAVYASAVGGTPPRLMMIESEVAALAKQGFDVGGHSVTHPILATLPIEEARHEIFESANWLKKVIGAQPTSFAYPNGRPGRDYTKQHAELVKEAGFTLAVSTLWSCAHRKSSVFEIPRVAIAGATTAEKVNELLKLYLRSYLA